jgi:hypothetical protein
MPAPVADKKRAIDVSINGRGEESLLTPEFVLFETSRFKLIC